MRVSAIIVAGGRGERLGGTVPKQFLEVGGRSLLQRSVDALAASPLVSEVIVVVPATYVEQVSSTLATTGSRLRVTAGGSRRQDSVAAGFDLVGADVDVVLVHDAARAFVKPDLIARVVAQAGAHGAAIAALRVRDTVKRGVQSGDVVVVAETIPRESVHLAQTPQGFTRQVLAEAVALGRSGREATDEAALAEAAGHVVILVEGDPDNIKVTTPADLPVADAIARQIDRDERREAMPVEDDTTRALPSRATLPFRIGIGYDSHRFQAGRPLILGGVRVPSDRGLIGHSDADAVCHAVTDAVLGAACLGDIGKLFPDNDPRWKDADSIGMLEGAMARVRAAGYRVGNVDLVVICERPKIGPHALAMRERLAGVLGVPPGDISIKGKTNEGVDAIGRGEALAVHAVAILLSEPGAATG